jgi:hypothetical protein
MSEEFEYGELVEVRDNDEQEWSLLDYIGITHNCEMRYVTTSIPNMSQSLAKGHVVRAMAWKQIRKLPTHDLTDIEQPETIEQRMDKFEAILNGAIKHINEQIQSIKEQIK